MKLLRRGVCSAVEERAVDQDPLRGDLLAPRPEQGHQLLQRAWQVENEVVVPESLVLDQLNLGHIGLNDRGIRNQGEFN